MSCAAEHFERLFASDPDPWHYRSDFQEQRRHHLLVSMLESPTYHRTFEPACASGTLTGLLAERSFEVIAWDGSANAVRHAQDALTGRANVQISQGEVPANWPDGTFDLIVLSDFLYYLPENSIRTVAQKSRKSLAPGGTVMACHWRGIAHDFLTPGGEAVHRILVDELGGPNGPCFCDRRQEIAGWLF